MCAQSCLCSSGRLSMDPSEGDVEVSYTDVSDIYVRWCLTRTHSSRPSSPLPSTPPPPPPPSPPSPGLRESPLLPFILQDPTAPTPELGRVHVRFGEPDTRPLFCRRGNEARRGRRLSKEFIHRVRLSSSSIRPT